MNRNERKKLTRQMDRQSRNLENKYRPQILAALRVQINQFIQAAERLQSYQAAAAIVNSVISTDPVSAVIRRIYVDEGRKNVIQWQDYWQNRYGKEVKSLKLRFVVKDLSFLGDWFNDLMNFFNTAGFQAVTRITDTTRRQMRELADAAAREGLSIPEFRDLLRSNTNISEQRANVIARTEVMTALNNSNRVAAGSANLVMNKEWVATLDFRTRPSHRHLDGETVPFDSLFSNGGQYPADPALPAQERIQCRCVLIYEPLRDATGRLITK